MDRGLLHSFSSKSDEILSLEPTYDQTDFVVTRDKEETIDENVRNLALYSSQTEYSLLIVILFTRLTMALHRTCPA